MRIAVLLRAWGLLALGVALLVAGFVIASQPLTFGWFGYAPSADGVFAQFSPALLIMPTSAALALAAGIAVVAGWLGFLLARRSRRAG